MPSIWSELERDFCLVKVRKHFIIDCHRILPLIFKEAINTAPINLIMNSVLQKICSYIFVFLFQQLISFSVFGNMTFQSTSQSADRSLYQLMLA